MKIKLLLLAFSAAAFASCSTAYKSGQTPDDVYYSPVRPVEKELQKQKITEYVRRDNVRSYDFEEREIRMAMYDRRWRNINTNYDYDYYYSPYQYGYSYGYYYNPYYYPCPVYITGVAISNPKNTTPRMTNLNSYVNTKTVVANQKTGATYYTTPVRSYNNNNSNSVRRNTYQRYDYNNTNNTNNSNNTNSRTYTTPTNTNTNSSSSGSSSSGSSSSGSVSRPARAN